MTNLFVYVRRIISIHRYLTDVFLRPVEDLI